MVWGRSSGQCGFVVPPMLSNRTLPHPSLSHPLPPLPVLQSQGSSSESDSGISRLSRAFARSLIMAPTWRSRAAATMMLRMRCAGLFADDVSRASRRSHLSRQQLSLQLVRTRAGPGQSPQRRAADSGLVREPTGWRLPTEPAAAPSEPAARTWTSPLPQPRSCRRYPAACA